MQARRSLVPHGAAAVEKARDEDDDRRPDGRRAREEDHRGARERPCSTAAARTTHGARRARVPRRDASAPLACSARSGDRRDDARQGHRPATAKTKRMTAARHIPAEVWRREPPKRGVWRGLRGKRRCSRQLRARGWRDALVRGRSHRARRPHGLRRDPVVLQKGGEEHIDERVVVRGDFRGRNRADGAGGWVVPPRKTVGEVHLVLDDLETVQRVAADRVRAARVVRVRVLVVRVVAGGATPVLIADVRVLVVRRRDQLLLDLLDLLRLRRAPNFPLRGERCVFSGCRAALSFLSLSGARLPLNGPSSSSSCFFFFLGMRFGGRFRTSCVNVMMGAFSESSESKPELYAFGERWKLPAMIEMYRTWVVAEPCNGPS